MNLGKSVRLIFRKAFQKTLTKQGMKFKLSTKVISAKKNADGKVDVVVEAATGGSPETVIDFA
jgi:dihydrolipoamide dehydrogenase